MKKLFRVDVSVMVMAESEDEALIAMTEEVMSAIDFVELGEASEARSVPSRWYDEIPFNADDELKCSEILKYEREQRQAGLTNHSSATGDDAQSGQVKPGVSPAA